MSFKVCNTCQIDKSIDNYTNNKRCKDGKENKCKDCFKEKLKNNKESIQKAQQTWRQNNPNYMREYNKKPECIAYRKQYYIDNSQLYKDRKTQWRKDNPERETEARKKYQAENKDKINEYLRKWGKIKRDTNIHYKLKLNTSRRIRYELNTLLKGKKTKRTTEYIGCSIEELKMHIEQQFKNDMKWENYGSYWHIDHIIPCAAWDLSLEEDNKYCWNFRNLRPLETSENQSKKDKYELKDKEEYIKILKTILETRV